MFRTVSLRLDPASDCTPSIPWTKREVRILRYAILSVNFIQWYKDPPETKDPVRIVVSMLTMSSELQQQISNSLNVNETTISCSSDVYPIDLAPDSGNVSGTFLATYAEVFLNTAAFIHSFRIFL